MVLAVLIVAWALRAAALGEKVVERRIVSSPYLIGWATLTVAHGARRGAGPNNVYSIALEAEILL